MTLAPRLSWFERYLATLRSARHKEWHWRFVDHRFRDASENSLPQPGMTVAAHHNHVGGNVDRVLPQHIGDGMSGTWQPIDCDLHSVTGKKSRDIRARLWPVAGTR